MTRACQNYTLLFFPPSSIKCLSLSVLLSRSPYISTLFPQVLVLHLILILWLLLRISSCTASAAQQQQRPSGQCWSLCASKDSISKLTVKEYNIIYSLSRVRRWRADFSHRLYAAQHAYCIVYIIDVHHIRSYARRTDGGRDVKPTATQCERFYIALINYF